MTAYSLYSSFQPRPEPGVLRLTHGRVPIQKKQSTVWMNWHREW